MCALQEQQPLLQNNDTCDSIESCPSLPRIVSVLQLYQSMISDMQSSANQQKISQFGVNLLDDYGHLLQHLNVESDQNTKIYETIYNEIVKTVTCDILNCKAYIRNSRDREKQNKLNKSNELNELFYVDMLDSIHCYFLHSYDIGFRINNNKLLINQQQQHNDNQQDENEKDIDTLCQDSIMEQLNNILINKRKSLRDIRGVNRMQYNKFNTTFTNNTDDTDEKKIDDENNGNVENNKVLKQFMFGRRYYYWEWYKNNNDEDIHCNPRYKYSDWYIVPKFNNLKTELLDKLKVTKYEAVYNKAAIYHKSINIQKIKSNSRRHSCRYYDIEERSCIEINHLLAIVCYTDLSNLSYQFSLSFRKLSDSETNEEMKKRNSCFGHWSKALRELVEAFGVQTSPKGKIKTFYHGTSHLLFSQFNARFFGPTSTTGQRAVATIFADPNHGIILHLGHYDVGTEFFNCQFLSAFGGEDERLFFGGYRPLQFLSIYKLHGLKCRNYRYFIKALVLLHTAIKGNPLTTDSVNIAKPTPTDYRIITSLIKHRLNIKSNKFPDYINQIFSAFCMDKLTINIDLKYLMTYYDGLTTLFLSKPSLLNSTVVYYDDMMKGNINNYKSNVLFLKYNEIVRLYRNCSTIIVSNDMESISITTDHFDDLLSMTDDLKKSQLNTIKIINPTDGVKNLYSKYHGMFKKSGWILSRLSTEKINSCDVNVQIITRKKEKSDSVFSKISKMFGNIT